MAAQQAGFTQAQSMQEDRQTFEGEMLEERQTFEEGMVGKRAEAARDAAKILRQDARDELPLDLKAKRDAAMTNFNDIAKANGWEEGSDIYKSRLNSMVNGIKGGLDPKTKAELEQKYSTEWGDRAKNDKDFVKGLQAQFGGVSALEAEQMWKAKQFMGLANILEGNGAQTSTMKNTAKIAQDYKVANAETKMEIESQLLKEGGQELVDQVISESLVEEVESPLQKEGRLLGSAVKKGVKALEPEEDSPRAFSGVLGNSGFTQR